MLVVSLQTWRTVLPCLAFREKERQELDNVLMGFGSISTTWLEISDFLSRGRPVDAAQLKFFHRTGSAHSEHRTGIQEFGI